MPDFNSEIANVPVGQIVGATMTALVDSQYAASLKSSDLFQKIAFDDPSANPRKLLTADFSYEAKNPDYDPNTPGSQPNTQRILKVPVVTLLNHQNLSIASADIELNVELSSAEYTKMSCCRFRGQQVKLA